VNTVSQNRPSRTEGSFGTCDVLSKRGTFIYDNLFPCRFYMVEKAKDANIVVLVVGTLGVANYLEMHDRLRSLITKSGTYA